MPKISMAGASDQLADPDYIAPPGVSPSDGMIAGLPSMGDEDPEEDVKLRRQHAERMADKARENDDESGQERDDENSDDESTQRVPGQDEGDGSRRPARTDSTGGSASARNSTATPTQTPAPSKVTDGSAKNAAQAKNDAKGGKNS